MSRLSLKGRIALAVGGVVAVLWIAAAAATVNLLMHEMDEIFDRDLKATAQRLLPIILHDRREGEDPGKALDVRRLHDVTDNVVFVVRDADGSVILQSYGAETVAFPPPTEDGFFENHDYRFYIDRSRRGDETITVAEPLKARREVALAALLGMSLPLLLVVPLALLAIVYVVRRALVPVDRLSHDLAERGAQYLTPVAESGMVSELVPAVQSVNGLMQRLSDAFEAERGFAANAAHELRTPVAGAIAQAQRLRKETSDPGAAERAKGIETTLKRLSRYSEKLMQLARAEGARLRLAERSDLAPVAQMLVMDAERGEGAGRLQLSLPDEPVLSDLDPDIFGILLRNLIENALRHGTTDGRIDVTLTDKTLTVSNDCPPVPAETIARLSGRFARGNGAGDGSGLGLAIVSVIADRSDSSLAIRSPRTGSDQGFEVVYTF